MSDSDFCEAYVLEKKTFDTFSVGSQVFSLNPDIEARISAKDLEKLLVRRHGASKDFRLGNVQAKQGRTTIFHPSPLSFISLDLVFNASNDNWSPNTAFLHDILRQLHNMFITYCLVDLLWTKDLFGENRETQKTVEAMARAKETMSSKIDSLLSNAVEATKEIAEDKDDDASRQAAADIVVRKNYASTSSSSLSSSSSKNKNENKKRKTDSHKKEEKEEEDSLQLLHVDVKNATAIEERQDRIAARKLDAEIVRNVEEFMQELISFNVMERLSVLADEMINSVKLFLVFGLVPFSEDAVKDDDDDDDDNDGDDENERPESFSRYQRRSSFLDSCVSAFEKNVATAKILRFAECRDNFLMTFAKGGSTVHLSELRARGNRYRYFSFESDIFASRASMTSDFRLPMIPKLVPMEIQYNFAHFEGRKFMLEKLVTTHVIVSSELTSEASHIITETSKTARDRHRVLDTTELILKDIERDTKTLSMLQTKEAYKKMAETETEESQRDDGAEMRRKMEIEGIRHAIRENAKAQKNILQTNADVDNVFERSRRMRDDSRGDGFRVIFDDDNPGPDPYRTSEAHVQVSLPTQVENLHGNVPFGSFAPGSRKEAVYANRLRSTLQEQNLLKQLTTREKTIDICNNMIAVMRKQAAQMRNKINQQEKLIFTMTNNERLLEIEKSQIVKKHKQIQIEKDELKRMLDKVRIMLAKVTTEMTDTYQSKQQLTESLLKSNAALMSAIPGVGDKGSLKHKFGIGSDTLGASTAAFLKADNILEAKNVLKAVLYHVLGVVQAAEKKTVRELENLANKSSSAYERVMFEKCAYPISIFPKVNSKETLYIVNKWIAFEAFYDKPPPQLTPLKSLMLGTEEEKETATTTRSYQAGTRVSLKGSGQKVPIVHMPGVMITDINPKSDLEVTKASATLRQLITSTRNTSVFRKKQKSLPSDEDGSFLRKGGGEHEEDDDQEEEDAVLFDSLYNRKFLNAQFKGKGDLHDGISNPIREIWQSVLKQEFLLGEEGFTKTGQKVAERVTVSSVKKFIHTFHRFFSGSKVPFFNVAQYVLDGEEINKFEISNATFHYTLPTLGTSSSTDRWSAVISNFFRSRITAKARQREILPVNLK